MAENGKGALFKNDKKAAGSSQPDYTGNVDLTVGLLEALLKEARTTGTYKTRLAAWIKQGNKGSFLSVSINAPYDKAGAPTGQSQGRPAGRGFDDSDAPF